MTPELLLLGGWWLGYFLLHSLLAGLGAKRWVATHWPQLMPAYRLVYNALAITLVLPPLYLAVTDTSPALWAWRGPWGWLADGIAVAAVAAFVYSLRFYDLQEFLGFRQWRAGERRVEDQEHFRISPLHRYVRHPWYALALALVWTRDMPPAWLLTAVLASVYFVVGSRLEERKLLVYHGAAYRRYRERVPALLPSPWRHLGRREAAQLERAAADPGPGAP